MSLENVFEGIRAYIVKDARRTITLAKNDVMQWISSGLHILAEGDEEMSSILDKLYSKLVELEKKYPSVDPTASVAPTSLSGAGSVAPTSPSGTASEPGSEAPPVSVS